MNDFSLGLLIGFTFGAGGGLWLGFKLWRQTYITGTIDNVRHWR